MTYPQHPGLRDLTEIGRGGFGVVYRARQEGLDREVAIKILTVRLDERARARFAQECRALGQLSGHPHIVGVHDGGVRADDHAFLIMPFYAADSLAVRLKTSGPLPWREVADIGVRLAGALQTAHDAGILHRDIKPGNVLIDEYGGPRLGDFGQARLADAEVTHTGERAITPGFSAPEVLNGQPATAQSDIYALAATLVALLLGHPPFETGGDLIAMFYRVMSEPPPDLRGYGVPDPINRVLAQAMGKDPGRRFATAAHFGTALQAAQRQLDVPVSPLIVAGRPASALPPVEVVETDPSLRLQPAMGPPRERPPQGRPPQGRPPHGQRPAYVAGPPPVRRPKGLVIAAILAALLAVEGAVAALIIVTGDPSRDEATSPQATPGSTTTAQASTGPPSTAAPSTTSPSTPAPTTATIVGLTDIIAVAKVPAADAVGSTLSAYFSGVNGRDLEQAYAVFSPALRDRIEFDAWSEGLRSTRDSGVVVSEIDRPDGESLQVLASFTSRQAAEDGPVPGETCNNWRLAYTLIPSVDGPTPYQIDAVSEIGPGHTAC
ncbi:MAG: protein kinase [Geodermatophilaceae bacterium]|nr:protein kinase [Geodermatophilaceae bacterium]